MKVGVSMSYNIEPMELISFVEDNKLKLPFRVGNKRVSGLSSWRCYY